MAEPAKASNGSSNENVIFDLNFFRSKVGTGRTIAEYARKDIVFAQGDPAAIFYIQKGKVKLTVVSNAGKAAVITILSAGDFLGEGCLAGRPVCLATATAMSDCSIVRLEKQATIRVLDEAPAFSEMFLVYRNNACS